MSLAASAAAELADFADGRLVRRRGPGPPRKGSAPPPVRLAADRTSVADAAKPARVEPGDHDGASSADPTTGADPALQADADPGHDAVAERVLAPYAPVIHLGARVRADVDVHVSDVIAGLRRLGVRTNRTELLEMLLWGLAPDGALADQLRDFRARNPAPGRRIS